MKVISFEQKISIEDPKKNYIYLDYVKKKQNVFDLHDIKESINKHYDKWLNEAKKIHEIISEVSGNDNKYWWFTDSSRFILWKTKTNYNLNNYLYSKAILELIRNISLKSKLDEYVIVACNSIIINYISQDLGNDLRISSSKKKENINNNLIKSIFKNTAKSLIGAFAYFFIIKKKKIPNIISDKSFIFSLALNSNIIKEKGDHFYGNIFNNNNFVWFYNDNPKNKDEIKKNFDNSKKNYFFTLEYGSLILIIKSLFSYWKFIFQLLIIKRKIEKKLESNFWKFFYKEFFSKKIVKENIFYEIYLYNIYSRIKKNLNLKKLIIPYEENGWQRAIIFAFQDKKILKYGYAHASHSQGHKYYFSKNDKLNFIRPDKILVTGKIAKEKFTQIGYKDNDVLILGSTKFHKIYDSSILFEKKRPKILFMCGVGLEIINFAKLLDKESNLFNEYELVIRENPHSWKDEQTYAKKIFEKKNIQYNVSKLSFMDDIITSKYILFETSTAGLEGILLGRLGMQINVTDNIYSNQFDDPNRENIEYCINFKQFQDKLNYYESLNLNDYLQIVYKQRMQVKLLIEDINLNTLKILKEI